MNARCGATPCSITGARSYVVDIVVVAYNSAYCLRDNIEKLTTEEKFNVIVVDNGPFDGVEHDVDGLPAQVFLLPTNRGFAAGCNVGWRQGGAAPFVLFLNADTFISSRSVLRMVKVLEEVETAGAVGPKLFGLDGTLELSQRKFPRLRYTFGEALFLHRITKADWASDALHERADYERAQRCDWIHGACLLVRRSVLEGIEGFDERFFHYCEDVDLCYRIQQFGFEVRFEPAATAVHVGGGSASRVALLPRLASSKILYVKKHHSRRVVLERLGIALKGFTHMIASRGFRRRIAHAHSIGVALRPSAGSESISAPR